MPKKHWRFVSVLVAVALVAVGAVVARSLFPGTNRVYANVHGDSGSLDVAGVSASRHSLARFQGDGDGKAATVTLGDQTARVTTERVELPGGCVIPIPAGSKAIELRETPDGIQVSLDGVQAR